jgi:hypothetical protein
VLFFGLLKGRGSCSSRKNDTKKINGSTTNVDGSMVGVASLSGRKVATLTMGGVAWPNTKL